MENTLHTFKIVLDRRERGEIFVTIFSGEAAEIEVGRGHWDPEHRVVMFDYSGADCDWTDDPWIIEHFGSSRRFYRVLDRLVKYALKMGLTTVEFR